VVLIVGSLLLPYSSWIAEFPPGFREWLTAIEQVTAGVLVILAWTPRTSMNEFRRVKRRLTRAAVIIGGLWMLTIIFPVIIRSRTLVAGMTSGTVHLQWIAPQTGQTLAPTPPVLPNPVLSHLVNPSQRPTWPIKPIVLFRRLAGSVLLPVQQSAYFAGQHLVFYTIPFWMVVLAMLLPMVPIEIGYRRLASREQDKLCPSCGYNSCGNVSSVCPECGNQEW